MQAAGRRWQTAKTARGSVHKGHLGKAAPMQTGDKFKAIR
jgi:hypothetical protein